MIHCVEDDKSIREVELYALRSAGFESRGFENGKEFFTALEDGEIPELVLLDIMLPGMDGVEILQQLKSQPAFRKIPVIMATAKGTEFDKVSSLDLGADDYLVKPFGMLEMISRVRAVIRRCAPPQDEVLSQGRLSLDPVSRTVSVDGREIDLTYKEFELLYLFMSRPGMAFTRDQLFNAVWGEDFDGETRTLDMHIRTLRRKLADDASCIQTVRNVGYRFRRES